ncbi:MAG: polymerase, sigma-24 subunit, subfamily [Bacteroidetes bacterium]|nr:polymerase, sigma-24 subunit, subfamily [Bacteroidota bacterium]
MSGKNITDEHKLIAGCREGKSWAQKAIYELYAPTMMSVCVRYVTDRETARDILQEGFIKLFTKIDSFTGAGAFAGWVRRIFVTTALEYLRQNDILKQSTNIEDYGNYIENEEETVLQKISADDLMACIAQLSDGYRTVFNLYAIEGYSHAEIAEILGISEVTSRSQFMRARKILQKNIMSMTGYEYAEQQYRQRTR